MVVDFGLFLGWEIGVALLKADSAMAPRSAGALLLNKLFGAPVFPARGDAVERLHAMHPSACICDVDKAPFDQLVYRLGETGPGDAPFLCFAIGMFDFPVIEIRQRPATLTIFIFFQAAFPEKIQVDMDGARSQRSKCELINAFSITTHPDGDFSPCSLAVLSALEFTPNKLQQLFMSKGIFEPVANDFLFYKILLFNDLYFLILLGKH